MASIRQLNQAGPFWDFVSNMEEQGFAHPFFPDINHNHMPGDETDQSGPGGFPFGGQFAHRGRHGHHHHRRRHHEPVTEDDEETAQEETNDDDEGSSSSDDNDDNDAPRGSSPRRGHKGHHGRHGGPHAKKMGGRGRGGHGRGRHGFGPRGGPGGPGGPCGEFGHPAEFGPWGGPHHGPGPHGFGPHGGFGHHGSGHHGFGPAGFGPHGFGPHGDFGPHGGRGPYARFSPWGGRKHMKGFKHGGRGKHHRGFGPWGHVGSHDHKHHKGDFFHPEVDVFDTPEVFVVHASLPGAKKDAVEVQWDPKKFELNISGVIERPGGEELLKTLALDERRIGTFDRKVRLGSVAQPVEINVDGITAEMENGILSVKLPKVESDVVMVTKVDIQ